MNLQRKAIARVEQLGQEREARVVAEIVAENFAAMLQSKIMQGEPAPGPLPDDALRFRPVDDFP